jgi:hypothetical protein
VPKVDPLLKDLRRDDLRLANRFHHAGADVKHAVKTLLGPEVPDDAQDVIARIVLYLLQLNPGALEELAHDLTAIPPASRARRDAS